MLEIQYEFEELEIYGLIVSGVATIGYDWNFSWSVDSVDISTAFDAKTLEEAKFDYDGGLEAKVESALRKRESWSVIEQIREDSISA